MNQINVCVDDLVGLEMVCGHEIDISIYACSIQIEWKSSSFSHEIKIKQLDLFVSLLTERRMNKISIHS